MKQVFSHVRTHLKWYILLLLTIVSILLWSAAIHENRTGLKFVALNIGQGDSLFIESPTGVQVLIDGGPGNSLMRELPRVLPWYDKHIDVVIVTNPDKDHYEGFIPLLAKYSVDVVLEPGTSSKTDTYSFLEKEITEKHIPKIIAARGQFIDIGGGAYIEVLFPDRDVSGLSSNDGSIVAKLVYGKTSVMLTGDSTAKIEDYLIHLDGEKLKSTVLKAGHHGSRTSSSDEYVKEVSPQYAVISAGKDNSYGHPHKETLETFSKYGVQVLGTYSLGDVTLYSDGKTFSVTK